MEIECPEFVAHRIQFHYVFGASVDLAIIAIDDHCEIIERPMLGYQGRFPNFSFRNLAISRQRKNSPVISIDKLICERHSDCDSQSLSERASGAFDSGKPHISPGMSLKPRIELAKGQQFRFRKESGIGKSRV